MTRNFSLSAIETFNVVSEECSFTRAADILHVTPSAVSHRIKLLEKQLNVTLFQRLSKGVKLTLAGEVLRQHALVGINNIQQGIEQSKFASTRPKLRIAVVPSLAQTWLISHLNNFIEQYPEIELELVARDQLVDFSKEDINAHLHFGAGDYRDLTAQHLGTEKIYPVCHPHLIKAYTNGPPTLATLLKNTPLLHYKAGIEDQPGGISWSHWLQEFCIQKPAQLRQYWFSHVNMAVNAAKHQQGIALGWQKIVEDDIRSGQLVRIGNESINTIFSYFLVAPQNQWNNPSLNSFSDWLAGQM